MILRVEMPNYPSANEETQRHASVPENCNTEVRVPCCVLPSACIIHCYCTTNTKFQVGLAQHLSVSSLQCTKPRATVPLPENHHTHTHPCAWPWAKFGRYASRFIRHCGDEPLPPTLTSSLRRVEFIMFETKRRTMELAARSPLVKTYDPSTCIGKRRQNTRTCSDLKMKG